MAGSISLSLSQRYDKTTHVPLDGGRLYFYAAGTTTPQNAYQDVSLTIPWPNPLELDSGGNVPQLFFEDGYIKFRLTNSDGVTQIAADYVLVVGPSTGGGSAPSVDATTIMQPGFLAPYYGTGDRAGFVRSNGRTIGNAASGATERANSDTAPLYEVLYADPNLVVSSGRGASMAADYAAGKTIALPDWRGRAIAGLDDMGSTAAGRLTSTYFGSAATVLGAAGGAQSKALIRSDLPNVAPTFTGASSAISATFTSTSNQAAVNLSAGGTGNFASGGFATQSISGTVTGTTVAVGTVQDINGGVTQTAFSAVPPLMLATIYLKL